ncbi:MAG: helicase C-terminal domain-containing protein [Chloroflexota bacterium]|nr:helicase C-terminal domain-containing protein [Chloroflexota bacterium]
MRGELVAIDLETTGLDPSLDAILEIAAVRFRDGQIIETYSTLIDPQRPVPQTVALLTGITDDDVQGKPRVTQAIPHLQAFVGDAPIVAHNISFDASFLKRQGALQNNLKLDTYELAAALMPRAPRYGLSALASSLGIALEHAHRALDDAQATALVYEQLWQRALQLPLATLQEVVAAAQPFPWDSKALFEAALREKSSGFDNRGSDVSEQSTADKVQSSQISVSSSRFQIQPLTSSELTTHHSSISTDTFFAPDGILAAHIPNYEGRAGQIEMASAAEAALRNGKHLMIEAATGIGKSYAYLAPALLHAQTHAARVIISTSTLTLQDQLIDKDIPTISAALGIEGAAAVMKGRGNYLCPRRFAALRTRGPASLEELALLAKLLIWETETPSGDKQDITLRGMEHQLWAHLSAEDEHCTDDMCETIGGMCPFYLARKAAQSAQVLVVNHALLLADALSPQRTLPDYDMLIIDEAQHLEEATTHALSYTLDAPALHRRLREISSDNKGLLGAILRAVRGAAPERDVARVEEYAGLIKAATKGMAAHVNALFGALDTLMSDEKARRPDANQLSVTADVRHKAPFEQAQAAWQTLSEYNEAVSAAMARLARGLHKLESYPIPARVDLARAADSAARFFVETGEQLGAFLSQPDPNTIYWLSSGHEERGIIINAAPMHVGAMLEQHLFAQKRSIILTGATLRTSGSFDFLRDRLGANTIETLTIGSPFDYKNAVLHYVINDLPEPNDKGRYQSAVEKAIVELATALDGRVLALFTSYAQLRQTSQAITARLALGDITVYDQLDASGRAAAIDGFSIAPRAVLMGTRSLWEGVDLPVDTLKAVVIVRLPFAVPTDPVFAARSERYTDSFNDYSVPEAILKFRQGFGRLIRRASDKGVFVVLDGRITSKNYGRLFIEALPECTRETGSLAGLGDTARVWVRG